MKRRDLLKAAITAVPALALSKTFAKASLLNNLVDDRKISRETFQANWTSLAEYKVPDWFRDAKFGMWAHWGPQCQPERGDWYARGMYQEGSDQYKYHCEKYGHPSKFGFKDVINEWKAEHWNPEEIVSLYKKAGAQYFVALGNHHDNLDLFDSKHQKWNSIKVGPKKDLLAGWAKAAKNNGLPFGVSLHASHAWSWYEVSQRSDKSGPFAGVPYDGKLSKTDGHDKWWNGFDPQDLYAQNHSLSENSQDNGMIHKQWNWGNGVALPSKTYCDKFYDRVIQVIDDYRPELLYFDDTALPLWPVSDAGLRIAAHFYNKNIKEYGHLTAVLNGKILNEQQRKCMVWDIERGQSNQIESFPWQTDTCIGEWHYDRRVYNRDGYKSAQTIIHTLADIVSKNGNLLLNVPLRGDGTMDEKERIVVEGIAAWMQSNGESIFSTRPWKVFGEGPAMESSAPLTAQGFNEGKGKPFTGEDYRFTSKGDILYAIALGLPPSGKAIIKSLRANNINYPREIGSVKLLGYDQRLAFQRTTDSLEIKLPDNLGIQVAYSFKIEPA